MNLKKILTLNWKFWKNINDDLHIVDKPKKLKVKKSNFPCKTCIVKASCNFSKPCYKLEMDDEKLKDLFLKYKRCPDCGAEDFLEGPSGGIATNVECCGCGHEFNLSLPFYAERIKVPRRMTGAGGNGGSYDHSSNGDSGSCDVFWTE